MTNAYLSVDSKDLSTYVRSVTINVEYDEQEATRMGNAAHWSTPGLQNWSIEVECNQDYTDDLLNEILDGLVGKAAVLPIIVKPNGATTGTTNPKWTSNGRIFAHNPLSGSVGDLATVSFTIKPGDGTALVRAVTD